MHRVYRHDRDDVLRALRCSITEAPPPASKRQTHACHAEPRMPNEGPYYCEACEEVGCRLETAVTAKQGFV